MRRRRISDETAAVLSCFLGSPEDSLYGREILKLTGIASGSLYPILHRLESRDLLSSRWEELEPAVERGSRPRRLYGLNDQKLGVVDDLMAEWRQAKTSPGLRLPRGAEATG